MRIIPAMFASSPMAPGNEGNGEVPGNDRVEAAVLNANISTYKTSCKRTITFYYIIAIHL